MPFFTDERRQANMEEVMNLLGTSNTLTFNDMIFAFADIIQSTFMSGLFVGKTKEERQDITNQMTKLQNDVIDVLNGASPNMMIDMVVFSNLIMDAVEQAEGARMADMNPTT